MGYVLYIDSCIRPAGVSRSRELAEEFLNEYRRLNPDAEIRHRVLTETTVLPHTWESLQSRDLLLKNGEINNPRFDLAHELAGADKILIAAPFWDLSFPALLRTYIENISVCGITFGFDGNRMFGLCKCSKLALFTTRGGDFSGIDSDMEMAMPQLRAYGKMFGLGQLFCVSAEGIDIEGCDFIEKMEKAKREARELAASF